MIDAIPEQELGRVSDKKDGAAAFILVFVIVILALLSGILTTAVIIHRVAGNTHLPEEIDVPAEK